MDQNHEVVAELLGAYALDAVDGPEVDLVERHLESCPKCAAELVDHREVAAMMAYTGAPAPEGLWSRIVETLEEAPPALDFSRLGGRGESAEPAEAQRPAVRDELADRRARRAWITPAVGAAAAIALVIGLVSGSFIAGTGDGGAGGEVAAPVVSLETVARQVLNDPSASHVTLTSLGDDPVTATAAVQSDGTGYLLGTSLPSLDEDQTYQLWAVRDDAIISLGVLGHTPGVAAFHVAEGTESLAITAEVSGGVTSSANPALLVGSLS